MAEQAAQWLVQLSADDPRERQSARQAFDAWKRADPRHAALAASMESLLGGADALRQSGVAGPGASAVSAVLARQRRRRRLHTGLAAILLSCLLSVPAWMAGHGYTPAYLMSDTRAGLGEWVTQVLPDGTTITLNSASAVNLHFDAKRRVVELVQGEIWVEVAKDAVRPFVVETRDGRMRALGTRFIVSRQQETTRLSVIESSVAVWAGADASSQVADAVVVGAGWAVSLDARGVGAPTQIDAAELEQAWQRRRLLVDDQPLGVVLDTLARHRQGVLQYDPQALAGVRVSAALPLDDTDRALALLQTSLPGLRVRRYTPYFVKVDMVPAEGIVPAAPR